MSDHRERLWLAERHMQGLEVQVAFCCRTTATKRCEQGNTLCSFTSLLCLPKCQYWECAGFTSVCFLPCERAGACCQ